MRIGIDARFYGPKQKGLGRYVQKLVESLEKIDSKNQYVIFLRKKSWSKFQPKNKNFKKILADYRWYGFKEQFLFPSKIYKQKLDLMYFPHFNIPIFYFKSYVITIHDLILKKFPTRRASNLNYFLYLFKNFAYRLIILSAIKRAKKIIAVSSYTKKDIIKYFKISSNKIKVIYEGAPTLSCHSCPPSCHSRAGGNLLRKPYLLYVGNAYPHKNLERLILVFNRLNKKNNLRLVLVGELDYFYRKLQKLAKNNKNIIFTDFVSDKELNSLYQNALLYIFPSLCEGFGLPPLEAMSYGVAVVCSNNSCLPEILDKSVLYFDPYSKKDILNKIQYLLNNPKDRQKLVSNGFKTIKKYSWSKMGQEISDVFEDVGLTK